MHYSEENELSDRYKDFIKAFGGTIEQLKNYAPDDEYLYKHKNCRMDNEATMDFSQLLNNNETIYYNQTEIKPLSKPVIKGSGNTIGNENLTGKKYGDAKYVDKNCQLMAVLKKDLSTTHCFKEKLKEISDYLHNCGFKIKPIYSFKRNNRVSIISQLSKLDDVDGGL